ncbi:hypothetical protein PIB30_068434 [Stylosanthes scabra]|uniref:Uncharacterized protein n=1 Tax=Stylosanthes scabra TaxID=79078 RepID=A0ABU6XNT2_9FABA|nr:hypothetical protein [Stylosanthes scabra]
MKLTDRGGPSNVAPTPSLPPKNRPIHIATKAAGEGKSKATAKPIRRRSQRLAAKGGTSTNAPIEQVVIAISSDSEAKPYLEYTIREVVEMDEDHKEDPAEEPPDAELEEDPQEIPKKRVKLKKFSAEKMITWTTGTSWNLIRRMTLEMIPVSRIMMVISLIGRMRNHSTALLGAAPDRLQQFSRRMNAPQ